MALALSHRKDITGIAPSAAGFTAADLAAFPCPAPLPVLVMHGAADMHFPGFGRQAAKWWARCNQCEGAASPRGDDGCVEYTACATGGRTIYCEGSDGHLRWPARNATLIEFFTGAGRPFAASGDATMYQEGGCRRRWGQE
jgi:polyhydroxybutyrate depolymerase